MAISYTKLSQATEKNLSDIVNQSKTYVAAFKDEDSNYKIPIKDFKSSIKFSNALGGADKSPAEVEISKQRHNSPSTGEHYDMQVVNEQQSSKTFALAPTDLADGMLVMTEGFIETAPIPEPSNAKTYTFTAKRIHEMYDSRGTLVIYDEDDNPINTSAYKEYDNGIKFFEYLYDNGYTILIKVLDDDKLYYQQAYKNSHGGLTPECIFRLTSSYVHNYFGHRVFRFTFTESEDSITGAVYTITIQSARDVPFASLEFANQFARTPTMAIGGQIGLSSISSYTECPNHGEGGLPLTVNGQSTDDASFGVFLWNQNGERNTHLILPQPTNTQVSLRSEFIIVWVNAYWDEYEVARVASSSRHDLYKTNIIDVPSIIDGSTLQINIGTDGNDTACGNYALFKITAIGYGWEITPLYNCYFINNSILDSLYAFMEVTD